MPSSRRFSRLFALLIFAVFCGCYGPQQHLERGNYDKAIALFARRIADGARKHKNTAGLETAFAAAQGRDLRLLDSLLAENRPENWVAVNQLHRAIGKRQRTVEPLLPLELGEGRRASFDFVPTIDSLESDSRRRAADWLVAQADFHLKNAENGSRMAARQAHGLLADVLKNYDPAWPEAAERMARARALGMTFVLLRENSFWTPAPFAADAMPFESDLQLDWQVIHTRPRAGQHYDYEAVVSFQNVSAGSESRSESCQTYEKDIVLKVEEIKDSTGHVIERKETTERVRAEVCTITVTKTATASAQIQVFDTRNGQLATNDWLWEDYSDSASCVSVSGDARATCAVSTCLSSIFGPSCSADFWMLDRLADEMQSSLRWRLREHLNAL